MIRGREERRVGWGLLIALSVVAAEASPVQLDSAVACMMQADLAGARAAMTRALAAAPSDPLVLRYAARLQSDTAEARRMLERVFSDTGAPDSVRAAAAGDLAGLARMARAVRTATEFSRRAYALHPSPARATALVHALAAEGRLDSAGLVADAADFGNRATAAYVQGLAAWNRSDFERCLNRFLLARESSDPQSWMGISSLAGCALCAERLGFVNEALRYRQELDRSFPEALERSMFVRGFAPMGAPVAPVRAQSTRTTASPSPAGAFTVQIGSFGAPANAQKLQGDLRKRFDDVRIVEAAVGGKTYYRVRIGRFADAESAESYARERVSSLGLSYKVVSE